MRTSVASAEAPARAVDPSRRGAAVRARRSRPRRARRVLGRRRRSASRRRAARRALAAVDLRHVVVEHARGAVARVRACAATRGPCSSQPVGHPALVARRRRAASRRCRRGRTARSASRSSLAPSSGSTLAVDRPAIGPVVGLHPPPVEDAQVEAPVERGLHPARAARLERGSGEVQPHVAAGHDRRGRRSGRSPPRRRPCCRPRARA